jgi:hypothetical protein
MEYAIEQFRKQLGDALGSIADDLAEMRQRKGQLEVQVRRLVAAVAESGHSRAMLEELARKEGELQAIADQLLSASPDSIESRIEEIRRFVTNRLNNLRDVLSKDAVLARTKILKHTNEITMTPQAGAGKPYYVAEGNWDLLGSDSGLDRGRQLSDWRPRMVAGVCNAPNTPSLVLPFRFELIREVAAWEG